MSNDFLTKRSLIRQHPYLRELPECESASFLATLAADRFASISYRQRGARPYLQPRGGFTLWEDQLELSLMLQNAGADFIPLTIDSHTRQNDYGRAELLLRQSEELNSNLLNGYPLLAHGVLLTRELFTKIERPVSLRHGTPDARVLVEAALDSGITEIEGGGLCYCLPYSRNYPIDRALLNWQYVDRLCAQLSTQNRQIHRESFGPLTATMVPPFMVVVVQVLELLLAAEQGVASFAVSFSQTGSMTQDIATAKALRTVACYSLAKNGFKKTDTRIVFHQWMGAFPDQEVHAEALIVQGAVTAALCNADKVVIKTRTEALGIPDAKSNSDAVSMSKYAMDLCEGTIFLDDEVLEEASFIENAAIFLLDVIADRDNVPLWECVSKAVRSGYIDIPYSPHQENVNKLWTLRDKKRNIRIADPGLVPIPLAFIAREKQKLGERALDTSLDRMLDDVLLMVRNQ